LYHEVARRSTAAAERDGALRSLRGDFNRRLRDQERHALSIRRAPRSGTHGRPALQAGPPNVPCAPPDLVLSCDGLVAFLLRLPCHGQCEIAL